MKIAIEKNRDSVDIQIPKAIFQQCGFDGEVNLEVHKHKLVIRSAHKPRTGWNKTFQAMAQNKDDILFDCVAEESSDWDNEEWEWKE
ncbi:MAG: AbrB/MazE/SpoVT family DNA-binding domain-containing protein [Kiritimatiellae bacterium]|jgi:antitoxin component of MazEF toxin-antitoxin module|nr:AbrB/MazE/SpoVT family DNA-binding domain-containing protein [Kiritimatiellia bacterium]